MLAVLRWLGPALIPALFLLLVIYWSDRNREPLRLVVGTFVLGIVTAAGAAGIEFGAATWTGLADDRSANASGGMIFLFALVAPLREAAKVLATWPAFRSKHFDEPYDGVVYSAAAALGFASVESGLLLHAHPQGGVWIVRALLGLPANVFFACAWGFALGRAKQKHDPGTIFPVAWVFATAAHGLYLYLLLHRGETTILATLPLLVTMGGVAGAAARDLQKRSTKTREPSGRVTRLSLGRLTAVPSFQTVREAFRKTQQPVRLRWVIFGGFVTVGAMLAGFGGAVLVGHKLNINFADTSETDLSTSAGPILVLATGLLSAFPAAGYMIAKASRGKSLLEPALASAVAILVSLVGLGVSGGAAFWFAAAVCSPIAWTLSCVGAWVAVPADSFSG